MYNPKTYFIINPAGGLGKVRQQWPAFQKALKQAKIQFEEAFTKAPMHAQQLAQQAIQAGFKRIVAVGGDGTLNELVNGLANQKNTPLSEIHVTQCPLGTGNDWVRTYNIPSNPYQWVNMLDKGHIQQQDLALTRFTDLHGQEQKRYFVNVAGMGYDAFIVKELEKRGRRSNNTTLYLLSILRFLYKYKSQTYKIKFAERQIEKKLYTLNVGICRYSGGGMQLVPHAIPNDNLLACTLIEDLPKREVILQIPRIFNGSIGKHPKVCLYQIKELAVKAIGNKPVQLEVDGEFVCDCQQLSIQLYPQKLNIITPPPQPT